MKIVYDHVTYRYTSDAPPALQDVNVEFDTRHIIGICGVTGSGKSTFIQHINGILKPTSGRVLIDGEDIHASQASLKRIRQRIGMIFQFPERQLFGKTVWEELSYTLENRQIPEKEREHRIASVTALLKFDLQSYRNRSPFALSRAEQRKLGIAVILCLQPELLVLDEPTAGMDRVSSYQFLNAIHALYRCNQLQLILVSHNIELLLKYTDYLVIISEGKIAVGGMSEEIINASEQLDASGVSLPPVNRVLRLLHKEYPQLNTGILSVTDAVEEVTKYI